MLTWRLKKVREKILVRLGVKLGVKKVVILVKIIQQVKQKVCLWKVAIAKGLRNNTQTFGTTLLRMWVERKCCVNCATIEYSYLRTMSKLRDHLIRYHNNKYKRNDTIESINKQQN